MGAPLSAPSTVCFVTQGALSKDAGRYGAEQGQGALREALCSRYYAEHGRTPDEIFVSDGSKCDIGRMQAWPC